MDVTFIKTKFIEIFKNVFRGGRGDWDGEYM